ncbi:MAG: NAD(P)/FAD-dependent oxidoreductase [Gammaproteobacteria bacterium]|nr:NAD(P)/FAD-dependent oxidoreductase [Gammaproteobacteria bacterium]MBU1725974.1 NAD(P)/FAD-dependent oxidoreductase [Gammaproteobacteria bacterium]MBU2004979.1 NAD(P)/FAD-dependent oxidoreductase [Gammaproteobacteria bacterium]
MQIRDHVDVIIIGAGAAGLMCAAESGKLGRRVLVLDKADKIGKKILISGGGRCNFTNLHVNPAAYLSQNPHFCKSALARYTPQDFLNLMRKHRLSWHEKTLGQLFCDQKAPAVVDMLWAECQEAGVALRLNTDVASVSRDGEGFHLHTTHGQFTARSLVIATGGPSIPRMGATDFGVRVAKQFGLKSIPFSPALVPFTFTQAMLDGLFAGLAGVSTEVTVSCGEGFFRENMLFTHRGLSGPAMLQISSYWQKGEAVEINLLPGRDVLEWLRSLQKQRPKAELKTVLAEALPNRLAQRLCETLFPNRPLGQYGDQQLQSIAQQLQAWELTPAGTEGMRTAEVSLGGVDTRELSSKTMEARKVAGLYFIGETVDVTGWLGGYNFQWAWASGWCAGQYA